MTVEGDENASSVAESALGRGERHRAGGALEAAEFAYFEAACEAERSAYEEAVTARHVIMSARIGLGRIELMRGTPERALGWFLSARDIASDHWQPPYWQGCAQGWLGDYPGADRSFTAALFLNPLEDSIAVQRSYIRFKLGDLDAALEDMPDPGEKVLDDTALLVLASLHLERGNWAEGEHILRAFLDRDPSSIRACELMGAGLERRGRPDEALTWYTRAAKLGEGSKTSKTSKTSVAPARLGIIHARAGRPRVALDWLRRARLAVRPDDEVLYHCGRAAFEVGYFQESVDAWGELRRRRPDRQLDALVGVAEHELARVLIDSGDHDAALPLLERCVNGGTGGCGAARALAHLRLALAKREISGQGREGWADRGYDITDVTDTAKEHLTRAAPLSPTDPRFCFWLGLLEWAGGSPSAALPQLRQASDLGGLGCRARLAMVRCAIEAGDTDSAERELLRLQDQPGHYPGDLDVRHLARSLGAGHWSEAAEMLLATGEGGLRAELLAHCLVRADRPGDVDLSSPRGGRAGLLHGLAAAAGGRLDEARAVLQAVAEARPDSRSAQVALTHVGRLFALRAAEEGSFAHAAALLAHSSPADGPFTQAPLLDGLAFLMVQRRREAAACLDEALRRDPASKRVLHTVSAFWLNSEQESGEQESGGQESVPVSTGIAAVAALLHDEGFWDFFRARAASRYQVAVATPALVECRRYVGQLAYARAGPDYELLLSREMAATGVLRDLGGFPVRDRPDRLVCGPLMISLLGLECAFGDFAAHDPAHDDPESGRWQQLRQLFSELGTAAALLRAERPADALSALKDAACARCRSAAAPHGYPRVCAEACSDFDARHPGYARLPAKGQRLAEDATRLLIAAQLSAARRIVAGADDDDVGAAIRLWADAVRASAAVGAQEQTHRQVAEIVLGRAKTLEKRDRLAAALKLVEGAERVLGDSAARDELRSRLAQLLTDRGVLAANDGRLEPALDDLRRAVRCSPHSVRPLVNLSLALQSLAEHRRNLGDRAGQYAQLREAKRMLEDTVPASHGSPELEHQLVSVMKRLRTVCNDWAIELAAEARYGEALDVLAGGLAEFPDDAQLRASQRNVQKGRDGRAGS